VDGESGCPCRPGLTWAEMTRTRLFFPVGDNQRGKQTRQLLAKLQTHAEASATRDGAARRLAAGVG